MLILVGLLKKSNNESSKIKGVKDLEKNQLLFFKINTICLLLLFLVFYYHFILVICLVGQ